MNFYTKIKESNISFKIISNSYIFYTQIKNIKKIFMYSRHQTSYPTEIESGIKNL